MQPKDLVVVSGIGCSSNLPGYVHATACTRCTAAPIAVATGIKLANTDLKVVITGGDGDGYGIGIGHFIHAMRRNLDLTYVVMDNQIYGLTTGQASPTTMKDAAHQVHAARQRRVAHQSAGAGLVSGATYVARGFSGEPNHLADLIAGGIQHKGFALIDAFSPCVTYNKVNTYAYFKKRCYKLEDEKGYDPGNAKTAMERVARVGRPHPARRCLQGPAAHLRRQRAGLQEGPRGEAELRIEKAVFNSLIEENM